MQQDQFCLTFGKENWNTVQVDKQNDHIKVNTPVKTSMKKSQYDTISKTARSTQSTENKTTPKKVTFFKENNYLHEIPYEQPKRNYSLTNNKEMPHKNTNQLTSLKNSIFNEPLGSSKKTKINFEEPPHVSFSLHTVKTEFETKNNPKQYREQNLKSTKVSKYYNDPLDKYEIIKTSRKNDNIHPYQFKISQYKEDMNRLDSLIDRINQRINSSNIKFSY